MDLPDPSLLKGIVGLDAGEISISSERGVVEATGGVNVSYQGRKIEAGRLLYHYKKGIIEILDEVTFSDEDTEFSFSSISINLETEKSIFYDGFVHVKKEHLLIDAKKFEEISEDKYRIYGARFTTCDECEKPDWRLRIGKGTLKLGGYATGKNIVVELAEKPVFWFPYAFFPAKTERETGFLFPRFSSSESKGNRFQLPLYLVTSENTDATILLDYMTKRGFMPHGEFRYQLTPLSKGVILGSYIDDRLRGEERYRVQYYSNVTGDFPFFATTNIDYVSDKEFYTIFEDDLYLRTAMQVFSDASTGYEGKSGVAQVYGVFTQELNPSVDDRNTVQIIPGLSGELKKVGLFDFTFSRGGISLKNFYTRAEGPTYKGDFVFEGDIPVKVGDFFLAGVHFNFTDGLYYFEETPGNWRMDNFIYFDNRYSLSTLFKKSYPSEGRNIVHRAKPFFTFHITKRIQGNSPKNFEAVDKAPEKVRLLFGINNYLTSLFPGGRLSDMGGFSMKYSYDIKRKVDETNNLVDPFSEYFRTLQDQIDIAVDGAQSEDLESDIYLDGYLTPGEFIKVDMEGFFNTRGVFVDKFSFGLNYDNKKDTLLSMVVKHTRELATDLIMRLDLRLLRWLRLGGWLNYSLKDRVIIESTSNFEYIPRSQCWSATLGISRRTRPPETAYSLFFNLRGLGSVGR